MKRFLAVPIFRVKAHVGRTLGHLSSLDAHGPRRYLLGSRLERRSPWPSCLVFDVLTNVLLMLNNAACVSNVCSIRGRKKNKFYGGVSSGL